MTTFDKREEGFEKKFAHDEELQVQGDGPPQQAARACGPPACSARPAPTPTPTPRRS